jgi:hypothetical protein
MVELSPSLVITMSWSGLIVVRGLSVNAIPCAAAEAVYSLRSASFNLFQSSGKTTTCVIVTQESLPFG